MSRSSDRLRSPGEGRGRRGRDINEITMSKYLLLKHYRGGPEPHRPVPPMDQWAPEDVEAHMAFLRHVAELLQERGEYSTARRLCPRAPGCATAARTPRPATWSPAGT
jgi:hypothetical protein